jgi:energy-coupling factor transporter ATP-binding protein EcfA2
MADPLVMARRVTYRYPQATGDALAAIDIDIDPGELVVMAGRSGSGKTTLLRACCGLVPHYHGGEVVGSLRVAGMDVREHGPADLGAAVGLVAQDPETQVVSTTVRAELELPLEMRAESVAARARAVEEVALALAMPHLLDRAVDTLSGGELQRVALAAALVGRPRLVLLDEPTSQLDPVAGDELIGLLRRLNEEWGTAVVLAEHRLERCLAAADRAIALADGRIAFDGSPREFVRWALDHDPALATPGARLFELAGVGPPPVGVKEARRMLRHRGLDLSGPPAPRKPIRRPGGAREPALVAKGAWVELDGGTGARDALRGLDLRVSRGERVALMGRNGAGKTTLLRSAAGRLRTARGKVLAPAGCALLPQTPSDLLVRERVGEELPGEAGARALEAVGLEWAGGSDPRDLSGGDRQRLALAIVMAGRGADGDLPGLICLDEPTRGLDRARKDSLARWTRDLSTRGAAVVIATHDVEFAAAFAERVVLLGTGETIADGPVADVLAGGWYFATEVARILGSGGAILPERGAEILCGRSQAAARETIREAR